MDIFNKIAKNTFIHLAGKFITLILGLAVVMVLTRYLGQTGFGYYSTVIAYLMFFGILVDFGLTLTTIQMISNPKNEFNKTINNIMSLRVTLSLILVTLTPLIIWFLPYPNEVKFGVLLACFSFFCVTLTQTLTSVFQQKLQMMKVTIAEVIGRIVLLGGIGLVAYLGKSIYWVFIVYSIEGFVIILILFLFSTKFIKWKWQVDFSVWKEVLRLTWPIALSISFNLIYLRMDTLILSLTRTPEEVGLYGATYRIVDVLTMLPAVFMGVMLPVVTRLFNENKKQELFSLLQKAFDALMVFSLPIVVGTFIIGRQFMTMIAGSEFIVSGDILKVLIFASAIIFLTSLFSYTIVGVGQQKKMMWGYLTTALVTLIGYIIFIPMYGVWGAAGMTIFSELMVMIWTAVLVYRAIQFKVNISNFYRTIPASIIMAVVVYFIKAAPVIIILFVAAIVYFTVLYLLGGIKKQTIVDIIRFKSNT